jgi:hypothetical protein
MAELDAAGVALFSDRQAIDSTSPIGNPPTSTSLSAG